jgi:hypothetical protein
MPKHQMPLAPRLLEKAQKQSCCCHVPSNNSAIVKDSTPQPSQCMQLQACCNYKHSNLRTARTAARHDPRATMYNSSMSSEPQHVQPTAPLSTQHLPPKLKTVARALVSSSTLGHTVHLRLFCWLLPAERACSRSCSCACLCHNPDMLCRPTFGQIMRAMSSTNQVTAKSANTILSAHTIIQRKL